MIDLQGVGLGIDRPYHILSFVALPDCERLVEQANRALQGHQTDEGDFADRNGELLEVNTEVCRHFPNSLSAAILGGCPPSKFRMHVLLIHARDEALEFLTDLAGLLKWLTEE